MREETFAEYTDRVYQYILELRDLYGTQRALAEEIGVSDTTISLFLRYRDLNKYPVIWKYLVEEEGFDPPPPVDPRRRRWMRTDDSMLALLTFVETYPDIPLFMEIDGAMVMVTADLLREIKQGE